MKNLMITLALGASLIASVNAQTTPPKLDFSQDYFITKQSNYVLFAYEPVDVYKIGNYGLLSLGFVMGSNIHNGALAGGPGGSLIFSIDLPGKLDPYIGGRLYGWFENDHNFSIRAGISIGFTYSPD